MSDADAMVSTPGGLALPVVADPAGQVATGGSVPGGAAAPSAVPARRPPHRWVPDVAIGHATAVIGAFVRRDWAMARSYRLPFVLGLIQSVVSVGFLLFLSHLVGPRIDHVAGPVAGGYFAYAVVGTVALSMVTATMTSVAHRLRTDQTTGTLEVLLTTPTNPVVVVVASAAYPTLYAAVLAIVQVAVAATLGFRVDLGAAPLGAMVAVGVVSLLLGTAGGLVLAAFVVVFKRGETATALAGSALSLVGGVYYPVRELPGPLRSLADVLPFTWALRVVRDALLRHQAVWGEVGWLALVALVAVPAAVGCLQLALRQARRRGTLAQY